MSQSGLQDDTEEYNSKDRLDLGIDANRGYQSRSEKRKSEVLIAAQSLDSELQHVKNLKRISIGSLDLLMDPELEFRVSPTKSQSSRSDDSSSVDSPAESPVEDESCDLTSSSDGNTDHDDDEDGYSYINDDSIDVTSTEYLESPVDLAVGHSSQSGRVLSGVRRRGLSGKSQTHKPGQSEDSVAQNLLWVPASKHPSVKPENFLELVQDTLHTLKVDPGSEACRNDLSTSSSSNSSISPSSQVRSGSDVLVRRPSGLRKSYTELEDLLQQEAGSNNENIEMHGKKVSPYRMASKSASLRDLTEELTRISNRAGFTDSDAVSLARTLSVASSYGEQNSDYSSDTSDNHQDNEFASSMFTKNGLAIPARSSLRRSKFNTYRIRTHSGSEPVLPSTGQNKEEPPKGNQLASPLQSNDNVLQSPNSFNDFDNIYDHYRQDSSGSSIEFQSPLTHEKIDEAALQEPDDEDIKANADTRPKDTTIEIISDNTATSLKLNNEKSKHEDSKLQSSQSSRRRGGWNWFGKKSSKDAENAKETRRKLSSDFLNVRDNDSKDNNRSLDKVNHSRNRHHKIDNGAETPEVKEPAKTSSNTSPSKKSTREKKFIQLFKRNRSASTGHREAGEIMETREKLGGATHDTLRTRASSADLAGHVTKKEGHTLVDRKASLGGIDSVSKYDVDRKDSSHKPLSKLQPSVNVTSRKKPAFNEEKENAKKVELQVPNAGKDTGNKTIFGSELELKPDHGETNFQKLTEESHATIEAQISVREKNAERTSESGNTIVAPAVDATHDGNSAVQGTVITASESAESEESSQVAAPAAGGYSLPPRKLTFEDVVKPSRPNAPMEFSDSSFGFPLPPLTTSTVVMIDQRLPINVERAIYRLSHLKLGDPKRELRQQVVLSNFMYAYLNLVNHSLYLQQLEDENREALEV
ncbi:LAME_0G13586g1_1 [Lachancea meyersii CBS 8951]|uniref:LAME_0G13586g1_1 n=1 Tax=Lachancea meyersii CBS 8951 TaxID=1266667 RepID=A0A1G4KA36_9SACH|nr:LAME_0G13586g1_1 [Lachancea meyersii CBS 8951]